MTDVDHRFTRQEQKTDPEINESTTSRVPKPHITDNQYTRGRDTIVPVVSAAHLQISISASDKNNLIFSSI